MVVNNGQGDSQHSSDGRSKDSDETLAEILDSFIWRFHDGDDPSIAEYLQRHPELRTQILEVFPASTLLGMLPVGELQGDASETTAAYLFPPNGERQLGEYRLKRMVGRGGMGVVFEARQESLDRAVAVKILPFHDRMDPRVIERFRREALSAGRLQHDHIVPVYGFGEDKGVHFYAMQYVEGASVDQVFRSLRRFRNQPGAIAETLEDASDVSSTLALSLLSGEFSPHGHKGSVGESLRLEESTGAGRLVSPTEEPLSPEYFPSVASIGQQAAQALAYAHDEGVLHRDVKPSNLLLDPTGKCWITDFGLAKASDAQELTRTGEVVGTLRYLAPEALDGTTDARGDVYSLGITLYELVTLQPAFESKSRAELLRKVLESSPAPPRRVNPAIPRDLETIVLKATVKDPDLRYSSCRELENELARFVDGRSIAGRRPGLLHFLRSWTRRHRVAVIVSLCFLLTLPILLWAFWPRAPLQPQGLVVEDVNADGKLDLVVTNSGLTGDRRKDSITVFFGAGGGDFRTPRRLGVADLPLRPRVVDWEGDGDRDIVFVDQGDKSIAALLNEGRSYEHEVLLTFEDFPTSLEVCDLDNDRALDLVVPLYRQATPPLKTVLVYWRQADGKFSSPSKLEAGPGPFFVAATDFDRDGRPDLVTANASFPGQNTENLSIFLNRGGRRFSAPVHYDLESPVPQLEVADLNGDGFDDVATSVSHKPLLWVLLNDKKGGLLEPTSYSLDSEVLGVQSADLNGDGKKDLVAAGGHDYACLLRNIGDGKFSEAVRLPAGVRPGRVRAGDFDGDGDLDLAITNRDSEDVTVLMNGGDAEFERRRDLSVTSWWPW